MWMLTELPNEILYIILSHLRDDLVSMCELEATCTLMRDLVRLDANWPVALSTHHYVVGQADANCDMYPCNPHMGGKWCYWLSYDASLKEWYINYPAIQRKSHWAMTIRDLSTNTVWKCPRVKPIEWGEYGFPRCSMGTVATVSRPPTHEVRWIGDREVEDGGGGMDSDFAQYAMNMMSFSLYAEPMRPSAIANVSKVKTARCFVYRRRVCKGQARNISYKQLYMLRPFYTNERRSKWKYQIYKHKYK